MEASDDIGRAKLVLLKNKAMSDDDVIKD